MVNAITPIAWQSISSATSSVTFNSISGSYKDLRCVVYLTNTAQSQTFMQFNGDTGANYNYIEINGSGTSAGAASASQSGVADSRSPGATVNAWVIDVLDYAVTDKQKIVLSRGNAPAQNVNFRMTRWANTSAITSIVFASSSSTFAAGSTFALYGIAG